MGTSLPGMFFQYYINATYFRRSALSNRLCKLQMVQTSGSRLKPSDSPTSFICFSLFTGYPSSRNSNTNYRCFALRSSLIKAPSTFQNFFTFTLLSGSSVFLQTQLTVQNTIVPNKVQWSALFLLPGSSYLEPTPCFCPSFCLCQFFRIFLENLSLF